jgi:hypothetical protein
MWTKRRGRLLCLPATNGRGVIVGNLREAGPAGE